MNLKLSLIIFSLVVPGLCHAMGKKPSIEQIPIINMKESLEQSQATEKALAVLQESMSQKIKNVEADLKADKVEEALTGAKEILDIIRVKSGIDPKVQIRERLLVGTHFPDEVVLMSQLGEQQKDIIIQTVRDFRAGLYMDLVTLSKRAALLYARALRGVCIKRGGLTDADKEKIMDDLAMVVLYPLMIEDLGGRVVVAFEKDIANPDHTYLFNREIEVFLVQEMGLKDIREFGWAQGRIESGMRYKLEKLTSTQPVYSTSKDAARECMKRGEDTMNQRVKCFLDNYRSMRDIGECHDLWYLLGLGDYSSDFSYRRKCQSL